MSIASGSNASGDPAATARKFDASAQEAKAASNRLSSTLPAAPMTTSRVRGAVPRTRRTDRESSDASLGAATNLEEAFSKPKEGNAKQKEGNSKANGSEIQVFFFCQSNVFNRLSYESKKASLSMSVWP